MSKAPRVFENFIPAVVRVIGAETLAGQQLLVKYMGRIRQFYTEQRARADLGISQIVRNMVENPEISMVYSKLQNQEYVDVIVHPTSTTSKIPPHKYTYRPTLTYLASTGYFGFPSDNPDDFFFTHDRGLPLKVYRMAEMYRTGIRPPYFMFDGERKFLPSDYITEADLFDTDFDVFGFMDEYGRVLQSPLNSSAHTTISMPAFPFILDPGYLVWDGVFQAAPPLGTTWPSVPRPPPLPRPLGFVGHWDPGPNTVFDGYRGGTATAVSYHLPETAGGGSIILVPEYLSSYSDIGPHSAIFDMTAYTQKELEFKHEKEPVKFAPIGYLRSVNHNFVEFLQITVLFKRVT